jgi:hypothetical protein
MGGCAAMSRSLTFRVLEAMVMDFIEPDSSIFTAGHGHWLV